MSKYFKSLNIIIQQQLLRIIYNASSYFLLVISLLPMKYVKNIVYNKNAFWKIIEKAIIIKYKL